MATSSQVVRFQKDSSGTNGATQDVNLNFTPKAIIIFSQGGATTGSAAAEYQMIVGFSDGTNQICATCSQDDGSAAADGNAKQYGNRVFVRLDQATPGTTIVEGTCVFATNKITFTWNVNDTVASYITVWAFGGDSITGAKTALVNNNETVNGATEDYTGLGFNPSEGNSVLFMFYIGAAGDGATSSINFTRFELGCAASTTTSKQWYLSNVSEQSADPTDTWRMSGDDSIIRSMTSTGSGITNQCSLNAWITDGFRLLWTDANTLTSFKIGYIVINGGTWDAGTLTAPTSATNDVDYPVSVNSQTLRGMFLTGVGVTAHDTITTVNTVSLGASDGTTQSVQSAIDEDAQTTVDCYRFTDAASIAYLMGTDGALTDRATFDSFTTNNFRLDWPTKTANAQLYHWVVVADSVAPPVVADEEVSYQSYGNLFQQFDSNKNVIFG